MLGLLSLASLPTNAVCGEGTNTSSPKNACVGGYAQPDCYFLSSVHSISGFLVKLSKNAQNLSGGPVLTVLEMTDNLLLNCNQKNPILKLIQTEFSFGPFFTRTF